MAIAMYCNSRPPEWRQSFWANCNYKAHNVTAYIFNNPSVFMRPWCTRHQSITFQLYRAMHWWFSWFSCI